MNTVDSLAGLRDIHLPEPISWWPPAPGWWILAVLVTGLLIFSFRLLRNYWLKTRYRRAALRELTAIKNNELENPHELLENVSILLRRAALQAYGREIVSPLTGEQWLGFLDNKGKTNQFSQGPARVLGHGLYQQGVEFDSAQVIKAVQQWIKEHGK